MRKRKFRLTGLLPVLSAGLICHSVDAADRRIAFDIPSQPMNAALIEFSEQSGLQVAVNASLIKNIKSRSVSGMYESAGAIEHLLGENALTFEKIGEETIVIKKASSEGKSSLTSAINRSQRRASAKNEHDSKTTGIAGEDESHEVQFERISVVGTAIASHRLKSALPVAVYGTDAFDATGVTDGNELVRAIPQMGDITWNESWIPGSSNAARGDTASLNLKNLGASNTLLLINGRRSVIHPTTSTVDDSISTTTFNTNAIPLYGSDRVEILLDGASAIYGSDAIAGVVNIVTRKNIEGAGLKIRYGKAEGTGRTDSELTGFAGTDFDNGRGNVSLMFNVVKRTPQYAADQWYTATSDHRNFFANTDLENAASLDGRSVYTPWGNFVAPTQVSANGQPFTSAAGYFHTEAENSNNCIAEGYSGTCYASGSAAGDYLYDFAAAGTYITPGVERVNLFSTFNWQWLPDTEIFGEIALYKAASDYVTSHGFFSVNTPVYVPADAYYNPLGALTLADGTINPNRISGLDNVPDDGVLVEIRQYRFTGGGLRTVDVHNTQSRFLAGLKGLTSAGLSWESALLYSKGHAADTSDGYSVSAFSEAISGRSSDAYNPFSGGLNAQANSSDFAVKAHRNSVSEIASWDVKITSPDLIKLPAGELGFATGAEFRYESLKDDRDPLVDGTQTYTDWYTGYEYFSDLAGTSPTPDSAGSRQVMSVYGELAMPLVSPEFDLPFVNALDLQIAGRYERYSDVGSIATPKVAAVWQVNDSLLIRGSWSQGFKAPNLEVLNASEMARYNNHTDYIFCEAAERQQYIESYAGCSATYAVTWHIAGNENLKPERSVNRTAGLVYRIPGMNSDKGNMSFSADIWQIDITDRVGVAPVEDVISRDLYLRTTMQSQDSRIVRNDANSEQQSLFINTGLQAAGQILFIQTDYQNQNSLSVKGADFAMDGAYKSLEWGDFSFHLAASKLISYQQALTAEMEEVKAAQDNGLIDGFVVIGNGNETGVNGKKPEWKGLARFTWQFRKLICRLSAQYIHHLNDGRYADGSDFKVPSMTTWNASVKYTFDDSPAGAVDAELGVRNMFRQSPPLNASGDYLANLYLPFSRYFYASAEVRF